VARLLAGRPGAGKEFFLFATTLTLTPTRLPIQLVLRTLSSGVKRLRREADHSPPSITEVKNTWRYKSTSSIRLHGMVLN
jgi:hypothetical protein